MFEQYAFHLGGSNGESAVLDHLLAAINDVEESFLILPGDVAAPIPAIAKNRIGSGLGLPIALHELRAAHDQLAGLAGFHFVAVIIEDAAIRERRRIADRSRTIKLWLEETQVRDRGSLGHPIALANANAGLLREAIREVGCQRRGAGLHPAEFVVARK